MPETASLTVSSTSDDLHVIESVARNDQEGARVPAPTPEVSEMDGSTVVSYNHPRSERTLLLERLAEAENDLDTEFAELSAERVSGTDLPSDAAETNESEQPDPEIIDAVRQAAINDAVQHAREKYSREQTESHLSAPAVDPLRAHVVQKFYQQVASLGGDLTASNVIVPRAIESVLFTHDGGAQVALYLDANPDQAHALCQMPESSAIAEVARLAATLTSRARRQISNAPAPINPVRGSSTKSTVPLDELPYSEYRAIRDKQEKSRYRR